MASNDFEHRLVEALQPIRFFALAQALHVVMDSGVYDTLDAEPGLDAATIAKQHGLDPERFQALCHYLANEGYIVEDDGWRLTDKARALAPFRPWYTLLVGGYAETLLQLGPTLKDRAPWAGRDGAKVSTGSCGMSRYDALPLADRLLDRLPAEGLIVVDLGCGDGGFLTELVPGAPACAASVSSPTRRRPGWPRDAWSARGSPTASPSTRAAPPMRLLSTCPPTAHCASSPPSSCTRCRSAGS